MSIVRSGKPSASSRRDSATSAARRLPQRLQVRDLRADVALHARDLDAGQRARPRAGCPAPAAMSTPNLLSRRPVEM